MKISILYVMYLLTGVSVMYLNCHSFITNPTLKVRLCAIVIFKYWHEAVENFCNELHDENCCIVLQHSQAQSVLWSIESQSINFFFVCVFFPTGTAVAQAQAQHPDGTRDGITYTIFSGNKYRSFSISSSTGQIGNFDKVLTKCIQKLIRKMKNNISY